MSQNPFFSFNFIACAGLQSKGCGEHTSGVVRIVLLYMNHILIVSLLRLPSCSSLSHSASPTAPSPHAPFAGMSESDECDYEYSEEESGGGSGGGSGSGSGSEGELTPEIEVENTFYEADGACGGGASEEQGFTRIARRWQRAWGGVGGAGWRGGGVGGAGWRGLAGGWRDVPRVCRCPGSPASEPASEQ